MPYLSRTRLILGDPDRDWLYVWDYDGHLKGRHFKLSACEANDDEHYHGGYRLPVQVEPGEYTFDSETPITVEVLPKRRRKVSDVVLANGTSLVNVARQIKLGATVVRLAPGEHYWTLGKPDLTGITLTGYGAVIRWPGKGPCIFASEGLSLVGLTFAPDEFNRVLESPGGPSYGRDVVARDCTFRRCDLGWWYSGSHVVDCRFESGGCGIAPAGIYLRCVFTGPAREHAFKFGPELGPVAIVDCVFDGTDRGPVVVAAKPIEGVMSVGLQCRNIDSIPNGSEIWLIEGAAKFSRAMALHTRITACVSSFLQTNDDGDVSDVLVKDFYQDGGIGFLLWGRAMKRIRVEDFELRNGSGIYLGEGTRDVAFQDGNVIAWAPARGNQIWANPSPVYGHCRTTACIAVGPNAATNKLIRVNILGTSPGMTPCSGFTVIKEPVS